MLLKRKFNIKLTIYYLMAKKSVFSNPASKESHNRNSFDRSFVGNYNFSAGMLIPTFAKFVFGHSHVRINQQSFFRTADVNTAAFPSLPLYTDYFFVPMHQLFSMWNDFRSRTKDAWSSKMPVPPQNLVFFDDSDFSDMVGEAIDNNWKDGSGYFNFIEGAHRLADLLQYGKPNGYVHTVCGSQNPFMLCAYQKIYFDHYRNTAYEANDVDAYNIDGMYNASGNYSAPSMNDLKKWFTLRYVNYRRDFFNTIYPSINFVTSDSQGAGKTNLPSNLVGLLNFPSTQTALSSVSPSDTTNVNNVWVQQGFTLENLRASFALEKLLRVSAFTPQHVKDQFLARFGYEPKSASMHESIRLKSFCNNIVVGEVTSTANTGDSDGSRLGAVGGKGVGSSQPDYALSYDVPEDGIIMGVSYVLPRLCYDSDFCDMFNTALTPEDFSLPEYENLGLQPFLSKYSRVVRTQDVTPIDPSVINNRVLGYQPRDMQFKASVNVNHGLFMRDSMLSPFTTHGKSNWYEQNVKTSTDGVSASYFKCLPSDLDSIFVTNFGSGASELNDQFYGQIQHHFACIQDKPIFGIPNI